MVVCESSINNIMGGIENTGGVTLHNHRRKLKQRFDIIKKLGQGTYGKVQLGINKETGQEVAIKTIKKCKIETEADLIRIRREIQIMSSVQHPNIIHIYEVFENREKMVLVMEYAAGGELYDYLSERKVLSEDEARRIFRQIAIAVYYCHKHKICHRDLKLENILLDENGNAKIADFGLSNVFDDRRLLSTFCGSPLYASPEIVKGTPYHGPEVDCWSLGVLLYTLVYGAMPFDGSNFKRLVKQISHGDYFEPKVPSSASPLIREMLTVIPEKRANIEKICTHWWVNNNYKESCLDIAEELANQTPVRLDLLLSLAPPPPQVGSDELVIAGESSKMVAPSAASETSTPARSQSVGSLMEYVPAAERRIRDLVDDTKSPKRKLEISNSGVKRKEKLPKKEDETAQTTEILPDKKSTGETTNDQIPNDSETTKLCKNLTQTLVKDTPTNETEMEVIKQQSPTESNENVTPVEEMNEITDPNLQGAACSELIEESKKNKAANKEKKKIVKIVKKKPSDTNQTTNENNKENKGPSVDETSTETEKKDDTKIPIKQKPVKKKVITKEKTEDENNATPATTNSTAANEQTLKTAPVSSASSTTAASTTITTTTPITTTTTTTTTTTAAAAASTPTTPPSIGINNTSERRRSKIFETAEKFQNLLTSNNDASKLPLASEKPKKIFIPGVNVGGFKKEFERKASLTSASDIKKVIPRKNSVQSPPPSSATPVSAAAITNKTDDDKKTEQQQQQQIVENSTSKDVPSPKDSEQTAKSTTPPIENVSEDARPASSESEEQKLRKQNAVNIISNALRDGTKKSKSRPCMMRKPPVPFGIHGRSASGSIGFIQQPSMCRSPEFLSNENQENNTGNNLRSSAEIVLKSATLPRRKTTKAEIQLDYPPPRPVTMEFKTEMAHHVQAPAPASAPSVDLKTQRSEIIVPVVNSSTSVNTNTNTNTNGRVRSTSVDPETKPKERIIPISFETDDGETPQTPSQAKPPMPKPIQTQRSVSSTQRFGSISRQSTHDSDSEATISENLEPIRKSPREYIIPIAVEGGGYVTPRATSLEPSETTNTMNSTTSGISSSRRSMPRFGRTSSKRLDGSEEDLSFGGSIGGGGNSLHRHNSIGRDSDNEDSRREPFHMHRLRSSRTKKKENLEHADSLSSGEEDDDDGFEILTAENLFSTLLSRVRNLTQQLNVDNNGRLGFPNTRLLSNFNHGSKFWDFHNDALSRFSPLDRAFHREQSNSSMSSNRSTGTGGGGGGGSGSTTANSNVGTPWRRSVSRDLASDIERVFNDSPSSTATLPRDKSKKSKESNVYDLDLSELKLSDEDAFALSYLTPGLSRRIQNQLLSQLPSRERRERSRKLSQNHSSDTVHNYMKSRSKDFPFSDSSDSELFADRNKYSNNINSYKRNSNNTIIDSNNVIGRNNNNNNNDDDDDDDIILDEYNFPRPPPKLNYSTSRVSEYSPIAESPVMETKFPINKIEPKIYRLEDIKKSYDKEQTDGYTKYTPYRNCFRSTSLFEPSPTTTAAAATTITTATTPNTSTNSYSNPLYYRNTNFSSDNFDSANKYNTTDNKTSRYNTRPYSVLATSSSASSSSHHIDDIQDPLGSLRRSRFTKPDYYDNCVYAKERKKREMETQKVLKEIRNKRINEHKDNKYSSRDKINENNNNSIDNNYQEQMGNDECTVNKIKETSPVNVKKDEKNISKREGKISKLIRPKSYPTECPNGTIKSDNKNNQKTTNGVVASSTSSSGENNLKMKLFKRSPSSDKSSPGKDLQSNTGDTKKSGNSSSSSNQFLSSIEKKIRSLYSESPTNEKSKNETNSRIQSTIRCLREQSEPRHTDHCVTESGLIKRAVSSEDFSLFGSNKPAIVTTTSSSSSSPPITAALSSSSSAAAVVASTTKTLLQPSKRSVSKILGLFKKYEDKEKTGSTKAEKKSEDGSKKSKINSDGTTKKIKSKSTDVNGKTKSSSSKSSSNKKECTCNTNNNNNNNNNIETTKSSSDILKKTKVKATSKLPISNGTNSNRNSSVESDINNLLDTKNANIPPALNVEQSNKLDRTNLRLNLNNKTPTIDKTKVQSEYNDLLLNDNTNTREINPTLFSPCDESNDSWSVCSDLHRQDMSPMSDNKLFSEDESNESVIDRIRRKSFYCRFNENKKTRKTSLVENRYYDKYADVPINNSTIKSRSLKDCVNDNHHHKSSTNSYAFVPSSTLKESKSYKRTNSMNDNYINSTGYHHSHKYGGSKSNSNLSEEDKLLEAIDKNLNPRSRRSYLKTPTKFSERIAISPPLNDNNNFEEPSTSFQSNNDIPTPL